MKKIIKVKKDFILLDCDGQTLTELSLEIDNLIKEFGGDTEIFPEGHENYGNVKIVFEREETDEEYNKRIEKINKRKETQRKKDFKKYEELKKKLKIKG